MGINFKELHTFHLKFSKTATYEIRKALTKPTFLFMPYIFFFTHHTKLSRIQNHIEFSLKNTFQFNKIHKIILFAKN